MVQAPDGMHFHQYLHEFKKNIFFYFKNIDKRQANQGSFRLQELLTALLTVQYKVISGKKNNMIQGTFDHGTKPNHIVLIKTFIIRK